jgi:hypothetical protein
MNCLITSHLSMNILGAKRTFSYLCGDVNCDEMSNDRVHPCVLPSRFSIGIK